MKKYQYKDKDIKLIIEEDIVGFYLIFFSNPNSEHSENDFLVDGLDDAFELAKDEFGVNRLDWIEL